MAEIFGAVASGAGLVSLSMQLLESTQKLKGFYDTSRDAPDTVRELCFDLETMSMALRQFEHQRQHDVFGSELLSRCIVACEQAVAKIQVAVDKIDRLLSKSRFAGRVYMGFKEPEVRKLVEEMEHAKSSMLLAYTSYGQSCIVRHHMQHASELALLNMRMVSLQTSVEAGHKVLLGQITASASQELVVSGASYSSRPLDYDDHPHEFQRRRPRRGKWHKLRVSLPQWFSERVWEVGMMRSDGLWTVRLQHMNCRPFESYVFKFVERGDVGAIRRLIQSGRMSFNDSRGSGRTSRSLLEVAAQFGHLKLCEFLLKETSLFNNSSILRMAWRSYCTGSMMLIEEGAPKITAALYHLLANEHGMDLDIEQALDGGTILEDHPNAVSSLWLKDDSVTDILTNQSASFKSWPWSRKFETAMKSLGWPAKTFLRLLAHHDPTKLPTHNAKNGRQALHWAAAHFGEWMGRRSCGDLVAPRDESEGYAGLVSELVRNGADVYAVYCGLVGRLSPFLEFLHGIYPNYTATNWILHNISTAVWKWGTLLANSGQSLSQYVAAENRFLASSDTVIDRLGYWPFRPIKLAVNEASALTLYAENVAVYGKWCRKRSDIPGAWPQPLQDIQSPLDVIVWDPGEEDEREGFHWERDGVFRIESKPFLVRPRPCGSLAEALAEARSGLLKDSQDDHGPVARMELRHSNPRQQRDRACKRRRASSMPPSLTTWSDLPQVRVFHPARTGSDDMKFVFGSGRQAHKCPLDMCWRICDPGFDTNSWRECMRGTHHQSSGRTDTLCNWEWELLESLDNVNIAERYASRFYPERMYLVEDSSRRAKERDEIERCLEL